MSNTDTIQARKALITRAITHLRTTDPDVLADQLAATRLDDKWKNDPVGLADRFANAPSDFVFPHWKAAQQVLEAAGLPTT